MISSFAFSKFLSFNELPLKPQKKISKEAAMKIVGYLKFIYKSKLFYLIEDKLQRVFTLVYILLKLLTLYQHAQSITLLLSIPKPCKMLTHQFFQLNLKK
jgi:hypothetical protein